MEKTALQQHIQWLNKKLSECQPFAPAIPFIQMAINNATDKLPTEREQIEKAFLDGKQQILNEDADPTLTAQDYFTQTYTDGKD